MARYGRTTRRVKACLNEALRLGFIYSDGASEKSIAELFTLGDVRLHHSLWGIDDLVFRFNVKTGWLRKSGHLINTGNQDLMKTASSAQFRKAMRNLLRRVIAEHPLSINKLRIEMPRGKAPRTIAPSTRKPYLSPHPEPKPEPKPTPVVVSERVVFSDLDEAKAEVALDLVKAMKGHDILVSISFIPATINEY